MTKMQPDLGLSYLKNGITNSKPIYFYEVTIPHIEFVGKSAFTIMQQINSGGVHAVSFDFSEPIFSQLLNRLTIYEQTKFLAEIKSRPIPFRATLPKPITAKVLRCHLGELVTVEAEQFVPFVIESLEF